MNPIDTIKYEKNYSIKEFNMISVKLPIIFVYTNNFKTYVYVYEENNVILNSLIISESIR